MTGTDQSELVIEESRLRNWNFDPIPFRIGPEQAMLYALGLGFGADPVDAAQLQYVYEDGLKVFPTMAAVLGSPGMWFRDPSSGIDWRKVVHGEMHLDLLEPLRTDLEMIATSKVVDVVDKGEGRGAIFTVERTFTAGDRKIARGRSAYFARANGGFGGSPGEPAPKWVQPERPADVVIDLPTLPQQALIYRLNGDTNPLHADPDMARKAGFDRPILHGLCTYGLCARAICAGFAGDDGDRMTQFGGRFSKPVYPGETIRVEGWDEGEEILFEAFCVERDCKVFVNGRARLS